MNFKLLGCIFILFVSISANSQKSAAKFKKSTEYTTETGLKFFIYHTNDCKKLAPAKIEDMMTLSMSYYNSKDSLFSESPKDKPFEIPMMAPTYKDDIFTALAMLHKGDSAVIYLSTDSFFMKTVGQPSIPDYIGQGLSMKICVKVLDILSVQQIKEKQEKEMKEKSAAENAIIQNYILGNKIMQKADADGIYFMEETIGTGDFAEKGKFAVLHLIGEKLDSTLLFDTYKLNQPANYQVGSAKIGVGFDNCLLKMKKGGKALLIIPSSQAFGEKGNGEIIPPFTPLKIEVEILDILSEEQLKAIQEKDLKEKQLAEETQLSEFILKNFPKAIRTKSGLYFNEVVVGTGMSISSGSMVKVHYSGTLLNGKKFDSSYDRNTPFEFTIGQGQVIPGWDEGIAMMKEGGKATLIIPSALGYGASGSGGTIPPYSSLVFEVEIIKISPPVK